MKSLPKNVTRLGRAARLLPTAPEPNLWSLGWPVVQDRSRLGQWLRALARWPSRWKARMPKSGRTRTTVGHRTGREHALAAERLRSGSESLGNKNWRWRDRHVALVASLEETRSDIGLYSYRKTNVAVVIE